MGLTKTLKGGKSFYDGKKLWEVYMSWGRASSYDKLQEWCEANGMINPATGKASRMGPRWAMWKYAFNNPEEAYPHYKKWAEEYLSLLMDAGNPPTWENFLKDLKAQAQGRIEIASKKNFEKWQEQYRVW